MLFADWPTDALKNPTNEKPITKIYLKVHDKFILIPDRKYTRNPPLNLGNQWKMKNKKEITKKNTNKGEYK